MSGSSNNKGICSALFGKVRSSVLALLFCHSDRSFYLREIIRHVGAGQGAVQRELDLLLKSGLVTRRRVGNQVHYQANNEASIFRELKSLMTKTAGLADSLRQSLEPLRKRIVAAFVHGSLAKGTETAESDADVVVIGDATFSEVTDHLFASQGELGRDVNPSVYPTEEFRKKVSEGNHFLTGLIDEPKIFLIGDEDEFGRLVGKRLAR